jgi:hypothetical protein
MSDNKIEHSRPLRSARWFRKDDLPGFVHRSTLAAAGWSREDLMERPIVRHPEHLVRHQSVQSQPARPCGGGEDGNP